MLSKEHNRRRNILVISVRLETFFLMSRCFAKVAFFLCSSLPVVKRNKKTCKQRNKHARYEVVLGFGYKIFYHTISNGVGQPRFGRESSGNAHSRRRVLMRIPYVQRKRKQKKPLKEIGV